MNKALNMKRIITCTLTLFVVISLGFLLLACPMTRIKQVSGTEFLSQAKEMEVVSSFNWTTYIGCSQQRAYLESGHPPLIGKGSRTTVFWTPLSELPDDIAKQLQAGTPPWKPWRSESNK